MKWDWNYGHIHGLCRQTDAVPCLPFLHTNRPDIMTTTPRSSALRTAPLVLLLALSGCAMWGGESLDAARAQATPLATAASADTRVSREGDAILYEGYLSAEANEAARALHDAGVKRLVIDSRGGEINLGMDLGEWVFANGLDVEIGSECLSSCVNYVFPAGRQKLLGASSQLAWHGGAFQDSESMLQNLSAEEAAAYAAYIGPARERETAYFTRLGVDPRSTIEGQRPEYARHAHCAGWRYSLDAMAQLGIRNVHVTAASWQPSDLVDEKCIFVIDRLAPTP